MEGRWVRGEKDISHVENLRVSFMYCIVDNRIRLLFIGSREKCHIILVHLLDC